MPMPLSETLGSNCQTGLPLSGSSAVTTLIEVQT